VLIFLVRELTPLLFKTIMDQMCMMVNPLLMQDVTFLFSCIMLGKCMNLFVIMVFGILNDVLSSSIFNVLHCKWTTNIITWPKIVSTKIINGIHASWYDGQGSLALKVPFVNLTSSDFIMKIQTIMWEAWEGNI